MSTRALECGYCGYDHPSALPCPRPKATMRLTVRKLARLDRALTDAHLHDRLTDPACGHSKQNLLVCANCEVVSCKECAFEACPNCGR